MKKISVVLLLSFFVFANVHAQKKGLTKRTWLVYSPLSANGNSTADAIKEEPMVKLTFKSDGSFVEQINGVVGNRMKLPGKWSFNKKPETANGKRCINLTFDKQSNISPSKKVYAAVDVDFEIVQMEYNFVGHDQPYTGFSAWNGRVTLNEMIGDWNLSFDEATDELADENFFLTLIDRDNYSLASSNEQHKEEGTWSFKNNFITFSPNDDNGFMKGMFIDPAYFNAKSRDIKILLNSGNYAPCYLYEVIREDQLVGKWLYGELEIEFTKSLKFKVSNQSAFRNFLEKKTAFDIYRWVLKDNTITFYPSESNACETCYYSASVNFYNDGRSLTFGKMNYETSKWLKQF
jgi:hypothetical protein